MSPFHTRVLHPSFHQLRHFLHPSLLPFSSLGLKPIFFHKSFPPKTGTLLTGLRHGLRILLNGFLFRNWVSDPSHTDLGFNGVTSLSCLELPCCHFWVSYGFPFSTLTARHGTQTDRWTDDGHQCLMFPCYGGRGIIVNLLCCTLL